MTLEEFEKMSFEDKNLHYHRLVHYIYGCKDAIEKAQKTGDRIIVKRLTPKKEEAEKLKALIEPVWEKARKENEKNKKAEEQSQKPTQEEIESQGETASPVNPMFKAYSNIVENLNIATKDTGSLLTKQKRAPKQARWVASTKTPYSLMSFEELKEEKERLQKGAEILKKKLEGISGKSKKIVEEGVAAIENNIRRINKAIEKKIREAGTGQLGE